MIKKVSNIEFIILFFVILCTPFAFANFSEGEASSEENRNLAGVPQLITDGKLNENFATDTENWIMDRMGFRKEMIQLNAQLQYNVFHRLDDQQYQLGRYGDLNYATQEIVEDYAHLNLRTDENVKEIADSFQIINDYLGQRGIQFYYVQCYDKHSIYPEQFLDTVNQCGEYSKTDKVIEGIQNYTDVNVISLKDALLQGKEKYQTFSHWGDPTHWNDRGAFIGYQTVMGEINAHNENVFPVLQEDDFQIEMADEAMYQKYCKFTEDYQEQFTMKAPKSQLLGPDALGQWTQDEGNKAWKNSNVNSDAKVLLVCDSYFASYIADYFAESFSDLTMLRLIYENYIYDLPEIVEDFKPDIVILECAERVDRTWSVCKVAERIAQ